MGYENFDTVLEREILCIEEDVRRDYKTMTREQILSAQSFAAGLRRARRLYETHE